jgi:hypothetical protein
MNVWLRTTICFRTFLDDALGHHLTQAGLHRPIHTVARTLALQPLSTSRVRSLSQYLYNGLQVCRQVMDPPQRQHSRLSSTHHSTRPPDSPSSNYLTVPNSKSLNRNLHLRKQKRTLQDSTDTPLSSEEHSASGSEPEILEPSQETFSNLCSSPARAPWLTPLSERLYMSVYSSSSADTDLSEFSNPPARSYRTPNPYKMPRKISTVSLLGQFICPRCQH